MAERKTKTKSETKAKAGLAERVKQLADYCWTGVWRDPRNTVGVRLVKTLNLAVRSFLDRDLQSRSMSLTYSTVLAIVPAFAMLFAIARGFGFQNLLHEQIFTFFPAQKEAISTALSFVDSYLAQASQGVFVGIGLVVLLWTVISLLSSIEDSFNNVWDVRTSRPIYKKITDYISVCLIVPILMVCSSGISIFMQTMVQDDMRLKFLTPVVDFSLTLSPLVLCWLAMSLSFYLMPNTKVKFRYASIAGAFSAIGFTIVQILFVSGQLYVSKYNAIYGSFSFLPLLLVWLQLSWLLILAGCVLCYALQNVFSFNFLNEAESEIAPAYLRSLTLVVATIVVRRFQEGEKALSPTEIAQAYDLPPRLVGRIIERMHRAGLVYRVIDDDDDPGIAPAVEVTTFTVGDLFKQLDHLGESDFIPRFRKNYKGVLDVSSRLFNDIYKDDRQLICDIPVRQPAKP